VNGLKRQKGIWSLPDATKEEAQAAFKIAKNVCLIIRKKLRLE